MNDPAAITWQDIDEAGFMSLDVAAASPEASRLVEALLQDIVVPSWPKGTQQRPKALAKHRRALAVFFGELQRLGLRDRLGQHGMSDQDFVGQPFGRDVFRRTADALAGAGLLIVRKGYYHFSRGFVEGRKPVKLASAVTTFALSDAGWDLAAQHGVAPDRLASWKAHWAREETIAATAPLGPLVDLKAAKRPKAPGARGSSHLMPVNPADPRVARIISELEAQNAFVAAAGIEGVVFSGLKRVFNNGDRDGFAWQWGGTFTSRGAAGYESDSKADRFENMRIGGEQIVQVDIRAAHLTILYGLMGWALDPAADDPYSVGSLDRELVKSIVTQAIGRGDTKAEGWSGRAYAHYRNVAPGRALSTDFPYRLALSEVLAAHPILTLAGAEGRTVHDLNYHQSEIMMRTMAALREREIASLPIHDCLVVPLSGEEASQDLVRQSFLEHLEPIAWGPVQVVPALTVERPHLSPKTPISEEKV